MYKNRTKYSYLLSLGIHLVFIFFLFIIKVSNELQEEEYVTVGFNSYGKKTSQSKKVVVAEPKKIVEKKKTEEKKEKIDIPKTKNVDEDNIPTKKLAKKEKEEIKEKEKNSEEIETEDTGFDSGDFKFDWGGKKIRKLYQYILPEYPAGVNKEIDVKLKFIIKPDGTVGAILPLIKADTRLELAAINALKTWKFEPLPSEKKKTIQKVIITFPFRLK